VHALFTREEIRDRIAAAFSGAVEGERILRPVLREKILQSTTAREELEAILHPAVYAACEEAHRIAAGKSKQLVAEIPLLLETQAQERFHPIVLVGASPAVQCQRLVGRGLSESAARALLQAQWTFAQKLPLADYVIWNDGSVAQLEAQVHILHRRMAEARTSLTS
jgi:dephospho-CoA kinase